MSVLVKGMKMPICRTCPVCDEKLFGNYCRITEEIVSFGLEKGEKCPLIELPPHGRLIDADALEDFCHRQAHNEWNKSTGTSWGYAYAAFEGDVEDAPTILEAEVDDG